MLYFRIPPKLTPGGKSPWIIPKTRSKDNRSKVSTQTQAYKEDMPSQLVVQSSALHAHVIQ